MGALNNDYSVPSNNKYMNFIGGENKFRILSEIQTGFELWIEDGVKEDGTPKRKPLRFRDWHEIEGDATEARHFWICIAYNYDDKRMQLLQIGPASIQKVLEKHDRNEKWGDLRGYDIIVTKSGSGMGTKYDTMPEPKEEVSAEIKQAFSALKFDLDKHFSGGDVFESDEQAEPAAQSEVVETEKKDDLPF